MNGTQLSTRLPIRIVFKVHCFQMFVEISKAIAGRENIRTHY